MAASPPGCVIVAGMHRSGTSLVAGLLEALGVDMGTRLVPADRANPRGYFEDLDVVGFHQRLFRTRFPHAREGHADWGWTPTDTVRADDARPHTAEANALVARRVATGRRWGFKDPRTTLLLDFWDPLLPAPVYVGVYRDPSSVADSMQRLGAEVFLRHPDYARPIWAFHNRRLLDFARRNRDRCVLLNADALGAGLARLPGLLRERLGLPVAEVDLRERFAAELLRSRASDSTLARLSRVVWPDCAALYDELEAIADLPAGSAGGSPPFSFRPRTPSGELSIVIPTHDDATWLVEALASAEECAGDDHEILVLDDGSTDHESLRILDRLREAGQPVRRHANAGLAATRNALIGAACGRLILPLDADNRLAPGFVEAALAAFRADPDLGVVYGDRQLFAGRTDRLRVPDFDLGRIIDANAIDACAMFRRDLWRDVGGYDASLRLGFEDWEFWLHAGKRGWRFRHLPMVGLEYRVRPDSLVSRSDSPEGNRQFRHLLWGKHADLLLASTPAPLRAALGVRPPFPADLAQLPPWKRFALRTHWHLRWARAGRKGPGA